MPRKTWWVTVKNQTDQQLKIRFAKAEHLTDYQGIPSVAQPKQSQKFSFSTTNPNYATQGGAVQIHTTIKGTIIKTFFAVKGGNFAIDGDSTVGAWNSASNQFDKTINYKGQLKITAQALADSILIVCQSVK